MGEIGVVEMELGTEVVVEEEKKDGSSEVVRWEKFLPRMALTVLLVEADDSTRQIISALLRKCSYRVAAVSDGLMAWETLKGQPQNIDIILTEVELPSISGFALLSLIMEHDSCKNIPVIMMSSHDSISMVLKCMLRGAADFLIKPLRRNELKNLWQHVWRRHMLADGRPYSLPASQLKIEATAENNGESSHSSDNSSSLQKYKEGSGGSDNQGLSQRKSTSTNFADAGKEQEKNGIDLDEKSILSDSQTKGTSPLVSEKLNRLEAETAHNEASEPNGFKLEEHRDAVKVVPHAKNEGVRSESSGGIGRRLCLADGIRWRNDEPDEPTDRAVDFIGSFDNWTKGSDFSRLNGSRNKSDLAPQLELSLTRSSEKHTLIHSDVSAFSRYNNSRMFQSLVPTQANACTGLMEGASEALDTSQAHVAGVESEESKLMFQSPKIGVIPVPGNRLSNRFDGHDPTFMPMIQAQSGFPSLADAQQEKSSVPASISAHSSPDIQDSDQGYHLSDETANCSVDRSVYEPKSREPIGEQMGSSPATVQSASNNIPNAAAANHDCSSPYGGVSSRTDANYYDKVESIKGNNILVHDRGPEGMDSNRASLREAALLKFRLKRKDRCFEKKVRYQSRKKLAEQRPRVKGQFVRQVQNDTSADDALDSSGV